MADKGKRELDRAMADLRRRSGSIQKTRRLSERGSA